MKKNWTWVSLNLFNIKNNLEWIFAPLLQIFTFKNKYYYCNLIIALFIRKRKYFSNLKSGKHVLSHTSAVFILHKVNWIIKSLSCLWNWWSFSPFYFDRATFEAACPEARWCTTAGRPRPRRAGAGIRWGALPGCNLSSTCRWACRTSHPGWLPALGRTWTGCRCKHVGVRSRSCRNRSPGRNIEKYWLDKYKFISRVQFNYESALITKNCLIWAN